MRAQSLEESTRRSQGVVVLTKPLEGQRKRLESPRERDSASKCHTESLPQFPDFLGAKVHKSTQENKQMDAGLLRRHLLPGSGKNAGWYRPGQRPHRHGSLLAGKRYHTKRKMLRRTDFRKMVDMAHRHPYWRDLEAMDGE